MQYHKATKGERHMDWVEGLNSAVRCIEKELKGDISIDRLAKLACCSPYHFQRMFSTLAGLPLSEYIRRRRMSVAASEILQGARVIDVALSFGYQSPTAFTRAFKSVHGFAPSALRHGKTAVKAYPPITFFISVKGAEEMNYRIEKKEAFDILGVSRPMSHDPEENKILIPRMWDELSQNGTTLRIARHIGPELPGILGVCACNEDGPWSYFIAAASSDEEAGLERFTVPAAQWAIFSGEGPGVSIQELERRIFTEWLPGSGYEYANIPDIELYLDPDPSDTRYEVWIGVVKKQS